MPAKSSHLVQRSTTWHVRIDIPVDLRHAFGNRRILSKSLKTGDKMLAKELSAQVIGQWKASFRSIRDAKLAKGDAWREELADNAKDLGARIDNSLLSAIKNKPHPNDPFFALSETEQNAKLAEAAADMAKAVTLLYRDGATSLPSDLIPSLEAAQKGDSIGFLSSAFGSLPTAQSQIIARHYNLSPTEAAEALSIATDPLTYKPKSPISKSAIAAFRQHYESQNDNARTTAVLISKLETFSAYLTTQAKPLTFDTVAEYLDTISDKRQTRQGHLWALRKWHKYACRYVQTYRDQFASLPSPFAEHTHARVGKAGGESWEAYTRQEAEQLHAAAVSKGDQELADLIKFACYTGCRIEEIGRIAQATTVFDNNHQPIAFNVEDSKTAAGIRTLPIHPSLLPLYARRLEQTKDGFLFAGKLDSAGKRLNTPQQRFTKLKKAEGFTDRHVFHSFRSTTATQLEQAGANPLVISSILGHQRGSITFDVYSAGASLEQKKQAISLLSFSLT